MTHLQRSTVKTIKHLVISSVFGLSALAAFAVAPTILPSNGPFAGGNRVVVTNASANIGNGDITNITVGGVTATDKSDVCLYQSVFGRWYAKMSGDRYYADPWIGDVGIGWTPVAGDYDGDGITDVAAYNRLSGQWLVRFSSSGLLGDCWLGGPAFTAAQCDFDGDSKTDPLVYREADGYWLGRLHQDSMLFVIHPSGRQDTSRWWRITTATG